MTARLLELVSIDVESGVSDRTGEGFVVLRATATDGTVVYGQAPPDTLREIAHNYLAVAEAAEHDAAVLAELTDGLGLSVEAAATFVAALTSQEEAMRDHREGHDPTERVPVDPAIFRRLELGEERRRKRGEVVTRPARTDEDRKRRKAARASRKRNR